MAPAADAARRRIQSCAIRVQRKASRPAVLGCCRIDAASRLSDCRAQRIAGPHRDKAEPNRRSDVAAAAKPRSFLKQGEGLQAEGGKSRVAAADPGHYEQFCVGRNIKSAT